MDLGLGTVDRVHGELGALGNLASHGRVSSPRVKPPAASAASQAAKVSAGAKELVLASWHQLVDQGALQDGEPYLAGTGRTPVARMSPATAEAVGVQHGMVTLHGSARSSIELPVVLTDMVDGVVWVPAKSPGSWVAQDLGIEPGDMVTVKGGV